jgi:hypothetical protein
VPDPTVDPDAVANVTDPESGIMKTRQGWVQGYNAQVVVTREQIILAADVTTEANDNHQLTGMLDQAQANVEAVLGKDAVLGAAVADAGYWSEGPTLPARPRHASCSSPRRRPPSSALPCATRRRRAGACRRP